jgi:hypothetical protein
MTASLEHDTFDEWPLAMRALFDGTLIETKGGFTASLLSVDENGGVHTSLLSAGELFSPDARTLCFGLWPDSGAARRIGESGRATLTFVHDSAFFQIQLETRRISMPDALACFVGTIEEGTWQRVTYARITGGIAFELSTMQKDAVLTRWRAQIDVLKRAASAAA